MASMDRMLTIGDLAALSGVAASTIRYYEQVRLLPAPLRTSAGYRLYPRHAVRRLQLVRAAQQFGFSLRDISGFLRERDAGGRPCGTVRAEAQRILERVDSEISELLAARRRMRRTLRDWDRTLAGTPADRPAHLLERLDGSAIPPRRRRV
jgi:DNA-binding transcriptional MerR regulator